MSKHVCSFLVLLLVFLPGACGRDDPNFECDDPIGCVEIAPGEALELGVLQSLSGSAANTGREQVRGIELAVQERGGQLLGHPIKLQIEDSQCLPEGGVNAALKVSTRPQIVAILGTNCSAAARTASKIMSEAGLVMVSGSNTAPSLTSVGGERGADWQPGYFRTIHNDVARGQAAACGLWGKS